MDTYSIDGKKVGKTKFYSHLEKMYIEQQKYAELGRLAVDLHGYVCTVEGFGKWRECADDCKFISFCQKRSELLEGEQ